MGGVLRGLGHANARGLGLTNATGGIIRVYATLNPLDKSSWLTLSASPAGTENCRVTRATSASAYEMVRSTIPLPQLPVYFEIRTGQASNVLGTISGCTTAGAAITGDVFPGLITPSFGVAQHDNTDLYYYKNAVGTHSGYLKHAPGWTHYAIDCAAGKGWLRNGSASYPAWAGGGDPTAGTSPTFTFTAGTVWYAAVALYVASNVADVNFGATAFNGTVPSGYQSGIYT